MLRRLDPECGDGGGKLEDRVNVMYCGDDDMIRYKDKFARG